MIFDHNSPAQNEGGLLNGGTGYYRKSFTLDESLKDKEVRVRFGGVYMNSTVFVNGQMIGNYPNGYTPFSYDISEHLNFDGSENIIAVKVVNKQSSSRWYSGSGIYRDVDLLIKDKINIVEYGTTVRHPELKAQANSAVDTEIDTHLNNNTDTAQEIILKHSIMNSSNAVVGERETSKYTLEANS